jgi:hypothetical protein
VKIRGEVTPEGLIGNTAMDLFAIDDSEKPNNPFQFVISFTGGKFYIHDGHFPQPGEAHEIFPKLLTGLSSLTRLRSIYPISLPPVPRQLGQLYHILCALLGFHCLKA